MGIEELRVRYEHDANCSEKNMRALDGSDLMQCKDCAGIFDRTGKGVWVTDRRFDDWRQGDIQP
jgi:hypothetical protein